jgi:putative GTP pyrophosphokinase
MNRKRIMQLLDVTPEQLYSSGLDWKELERIEHHYQGIKPTLDSVGRFMIDQMIGTKSIHSLNYRLKDPEHLLVKIIRKKLENPQRILTLDTYREEITDLVGVRALHLFKEDWLGIHTYIRENWDLVETPRAYVRHGDSPRITDYYHKNHCEVLEHRHGYRSVHYVLRTRPRNEDVLVEVQVRTLFEEAWGEVDHRVRYPNDQDNELVARLSSILNRLAGDADELASYMRYFTIRSKRIHQEHQRQLEEKNQAIRELKQQIEALSIDTNQKQAMAENLTTLADDYTLDHPLTQPMDGEFPWLSTFLDSNLFQGIQSSLKRYFESDTFRPLDINEQDLTMIRETQKELLGALGADPAKLEALIKNAPSPQLLLESIIQEGGMDQFLDQTNTSKPTE